MHACTPPLLSVFGLRCDKSPSWPALLVSSSFCKPQVPFPTQHHQPDGSHAQRNDKQSRQGLLPLPPAPKPSIHSSPPRISGPNALRCHHPSGERQIERKDKREKRKKNRPKQGEKENKQKQARPGEYR